MLNQKIKFGIVKAFFLFMFFLNVLHGHSPNYLVASTITIELKDLFTKKLNLKPKSSESFSSKFDEKMMITVQISSGDLGSGRIVAEVYDPNGNKVADGSKEFSFNTKKIKGNYKFVVTNQTETPRSVEVVVNSSGSDKREQR